MLFLLALAVLTTTLLCETAARRDWIPYWVTRKILHVIAVGACAVAALHSDRTLLTGIVAGAEVLLLFLVLSGRLLREESGRRPWGIVWFPLAFLILLNTGLPRPIVAFAMLTLALCDPAATVAGKLFARRTYNLTGDEKSLAGNLAFGLTFLVLAFFFTVPTQYSVDVDAPQRMLSVVQLIGWPGVLGMALLLTVGESLGSKGFDNLIVPLLAAWLWAGVSPAQYALLLPLVAGGAVFSLLMVRRKSLTAGGALTAALLGVGVVLGSGSFFWLLPLFVFLLSSSLIGKIFPVKTAAGDAKQQQARDATQVLANGAVYGFIALFAWPVNDLLYSIMLLTEAWLLVAMAIATADTWSSEIGQYFQRPTYDLVKWRKVPPGLSGGVSWPGTLAGLAGSAFLVGTCWWLVPYASPVLMVKIIIAGFAGMLFDSVLGSLFQAKYRDVATGDLSDSPGEGRELIGGQRWMTNDLVNFLAILLGTWIGNFLIHF